MTSLVKRCLALSFLFAGLVGRAQEFSYVESTISGIQGDPNWSAINKDIQSNFGSEKSDSILQLVKVSYYFKRKDYNEYVKEFIVYANKVDLLRTPGGMNSAAWRVFEYANDVGSLRVALEWVRKAQQVEVTNPYFLDTFANILYKLGDVKAAIETQRVAVEYSNSGQVFVKNYFKMKAGIPTWKYPIDTTRISNELRAEVWSALHKEFSRRADSLIWQSRIHESKASSSAYYATTLINFIEIFKPQLSSISLNQNAWAIFQISSDKSELKKALKWSNQSLKDQEIAEVHYACRDTNANLLYKLGRVKDAIIMQQKALTLAPESEKPAFAAVLAKMKKGEKTWAE